VPQSLGITVRFEPHLDEMQHAPVNNSARYRLYYAGPTIKLIDCRCWRRNWYCAGLA
jgi:hypothetical protein